MAKELVSKKTRLLFREFLVRWPLRQIDMEFEAADVPCDCDFTPNLSGVRRSRVEQYYNSLDFTNPSDARLLLNAYENILLTAFKDARSEARSSCSLDDVQELIDSLARDGYEYENGRIILTAPELSTKEKQSPSLDIGKDVRQDIFDALRLEKVWWSGKLQETDFLGRLFDLESLPSTDSRYKDAYTDIWKHREVNPYDWEDDWIFTDPRFNLLGVTDEIFIDFLCLIVNPVVRPDTEEALKLVDAFNGILTRTSWEISQRADICGKPVFSGKRRIQNSPALGAAKSLTAKFEADYISTQMTRMESAIETDPWSAIGTAKDFVETICKTILEAYGIRPPSDSNITDLVKLVRGQLELLPEDISDKAKGEKTVKKLLNNLGTIAQCLSELRSLYGTGHGKTAKAKGLQPRHARLAVNAASTLGVYLFEIFELRNKNTTLT